MGNIPFFLTATATKWKWIFLTVWTPSHHRHHLCLTPCLGPEPELALVIHVNKHQLDENYPKWQEASLNHLHDTNEVVSLARVPSAKTEDEGYQGAVQIFCCRELSCLPSLHMVAVTAVFAPVMWGDPCQQSVSQFVQLTLRGTRCAKLTDGTGSFGHDDGRECKCHSWPLVESQRSAACWTNLKSADSSSILQLHQHQRWPLYSGRGCGVHQIHKWLGARYLCIQILSLCISPSAGSVGGWGIITPPAGIQSSPRRPDLICIARKDSVAWGGSWSVLSEAVCPAALPERTVWGPPAPPP